MSGSLSAFRSSSQAWGEGETRVIQIPNTPCIESYTGEGCDHVLLSVIGNIEKWYEVRIGSKLFKAQGTILPEQLDTLMEELSCDISAVHLSVVVIVL